MDCATCESRLEGFHEGTLSADERKATETHLASCAPCDELRTVMSLAWEGPSPDRPDGLAASILERTSGAPCDRSHERLGDYVDGGLEALDRELVWGHLEHCRECAALAMAVAELSADLPAFAELRPDARLVHDVLALTSARRRRWADVWTPRRWARLLERPRIAMEAGYVGAVVLWLLFGASWAPLRAAPPQLLSVVQRNPVQDLRGGTDVLATLNARVTAVGSSAFEAIDAIEERAGGAVRGIGAALADIEATSQTGFRQHWRELASAVRRLDGTGVVRALRSLGEDAARLWELAATDAARSLATPGREQNHRRQS